METEYERVKELVSEHERECENLLNLERPLTEADVDLIMDPLDTAENVLKDTNPKGENSPQHLRNALTVHRFSARTLLFLTALLNGKSGDPIKSLRGLTTEQKFQQIHNDLTRAETIVYELDSFTISEYFDESEDEILHSISDLKKWLREFTKDEQHTADVSSHTTARQGEATTIHRPPTSNRAQSSNGNLVAGGLLAVIGAILSLSGIGAIVGIPLVLIGVLVMFPTFAAVVLGVVGFTIFYFLFL